MLTTYQGERNKKTHPSQKTTVYFHRYGPLGFSLTAVQTKEALLTLAIKYSQQKRMKNTTHASCCRF